MYLNNLKKEPMYETNYRTAVNWFPNQRILCNNIIEVDEGFSYRFSEDKEIFQYFLTDFTESDVEFLEEHFGLLFGYSELLDVYVLCVPHYGTSWAYVYCETNLEQAERALGD